MVRKHGPRELAAIEKSEANPARRPGATIAQSRRCQLRGNRNT